MKTWISEVAGGPETLVLADRPVPLIGDKQLLIRTTAVGVNFPDSLLIRDHYQVKPPRPFTPGSEFCGVVEQVAGPDSSFELGDVVIGRCGWGAMAELIAISEDRCRKIEDWVPHVEAAGFLFAYATAYHALSNAGRLAADETLLVLGAAGGVGSAAVDVGRAVGARVIVAASSKSKLDYAIARGASDGLVYDSSLAEGEGQKELAARLKELARQGVDVVFDPVGGAYTEPAMRSLRRGGRHLVVGFTAGIPRIPLNLVLLKSSHIVGVDWRSLVMDEPLSNARNVEVLLSLWKRGLIAPKVTERFPFSQAPSAIARLESRDAIGKLVVDFYA